MEIAGEAKMKQLLKDEFGGWPMLDNDSWNEAAFDPIQIQVQARKYGLRQIVSVYTDENPDDPKYEILGVNY